MEYIQKIYTPLADDSTICTVSYNVSCRRANEKTYVLKYIFLYGKQKNDHSRYEFNANVYLHRKSDKARR